LPIMHLLRLISLCALLWGLCSSESVAQRRPPTLNEQSLGAPVLALPLTLPHSKGTREGALWSGVGALAGVLASIPVLTLLVSPCIDVPDPANPVCYLPRDFGASASSSPRSRAERQELR
jgi:hypothetical protein